MEKTFVAVDIETTGLSPLKDKIIEIGAVKVVEGVVVGTFARLVNPHIKLQEKIIKLTNITDEMLEGKEEIQLVMTDFLEFCQDYPLLGHNISFDYSFLKTEAVRQKREYERMGIDTLHISRVLHEELGSKSLENMCHYYSIVNENQHRAYDDAYAAMKLYFALSNKSQDEELFKAKQLFYKPKKIEPITGKQKNYLLDLMKYHKIEVRQSVDEMTKSEASRMIDKIILEKGKIKLERH